jgi:hypothetical protein
MLSNVKVPNIIRVVSQKTIIAVINRLDVSRPLDTSGRSTLFVARTPLQTRRAVFRDR